MTGRRSSADDLDAIEGADAAALGMSEPPESAPAGATVDDAEELVPGPTYDGPGRAEKPWASSLAAESTQAGIANEPPGDDEAT
jgi:hypothetical protein